jgi:hypothetical protein
MITIWLKSNYERLMFLTAQFTPKINKRPIFSTFTEKNLDKTYKSSPITQNGRGPSKPVFRLPQQKIIEKYQLFT